MIRLAILLAACIAQNPQTQTQEPRNLTSFIQSQNIQGPWIAVDSDHVQNQDDNPPKDLSSYQRKLVKLPGLSLIAINWTMVMDEENLPNAYQALRADDKLVFLLATLNQPALDKLLGAGLSPSDVSGEQREALLSMFPKPFSILDAEVRGSGTHSQSFPVTLTEEQINQVKIQVRRGVEVSFGAQSVAGGGSTNSVVSSLGFRGPDGTKVVISNQPFMEMERKPPGTFIESVEKKSDLNWANPLLTKDISLTTSDLLGPLMDSIRSQTGLELYADARIAQFVVTSSGGVVKAKDLLRGLALAFNGVIRRVGPAYILTANEEGAATRYTRLTLRGQLNAMQMRAKINDWYAEAAKRGLPGSIGFSSDDSFQASTIPPSAFAPAQSPWDANWVPASELPLALQSAMSQEATWSAKNRVQPNGTPIPTLEGQAKLTTRIGYRFVLPDGRPLEFQEYNPSNIPTNTSVVTGPKQAPFPLEGKSFTAGSAVAIRSDDPDTIAKLCADLKALEVPEVWIDTQSASAIGAAIKSGLMVDLVIHPWTILKGETCDMVDRDVLGLTGSQVNEIPEARTNPLAQHFTPHSNNFSPSDPDLDRHWSRVASLLPKKGIHRVILLHAEPEGYEAADTSGNVTVISPVVANGVPLFPGLQDLVPALFDFGYTDQLRVNFLRKFKIDPIDLKDPHRTGTLSPLSAYFDQSNIFEPSPRQLRWPNVREIDFESTIPAWQSMRHELVAPKLAALVDKLAPNVDEVFVSGSGNRDRAFGDSGSRFVTAYPQDDKGPTIYRLTLSSLNAEDPNGVIEYNDLRPEGQVCFDLTDVPTERVPLYLHYLLKSPTNSR